MRGRLLSICACCARSSANRLAYSFSASVASRGPCRRADSIGSTVEVLPLWSPFVFCAYNGIQRIAAIMKLYFLIYLQI